MIYSLDTNTCIRYITGRSPEVLRKLPTIAVQDIIVCSIVRAELFYGASKSQTLIITLGKQERFLKPYKTMPFGDGEAKVYAELRANLEQKGTVIGPLDMLIAAIAITHNLILVTHNTREFSRVTNLRFEDWEIDGNIP